MANYETRVRLISETNVNVTNNTSYVTIAFEFRRTDYPYYGYNYVGNAYWNISCDGQSSGNRYFTFGWEIAQNTWKEVGRCGFTVNHNANGAKSINFSGYIYFGDSVNPGSLSANGSANLTTIPRATTPSLSPASQVMGSDIVISLPRASSSFTHNLTYTFGDATGTIATGAGTTANFTIPASLAAEIPNAESGVGKITCKTYNGSTLIGTKEVNFTATVPDTVVPTISSVTVSEAVAAIKTKFAAYVQNKSKAKVVTAADGVQGSTINSCKVTMDGVSYFGTDITTNLIASAGSAKITVTVTDSRGRVATTTKTITVLEYYNPNIKAFAAYRSKDDGTEDDESAGVKLVMNFDIAPVSNKNTKSYKVQVQKQGETTWTTILSGGVYAYNSTYIKTGNILDTDYAYVVRLVVTDYFMETVAEVEIGTAFTLMDFHHSGRGIALGKVAQKEGYLEVNLIAEFLKNVILHGTDEDGNTTNMDLFDTIKQLTDRLTDIHNNLTNINNKLPVYITDHGYANSLNDVWQWEYIKLSNGLMFLWRCVYDPLTIATPHASQNGVYYSDDVTWETIDSVGMVTLQSTWATLDRRNNAGLPWICVLNSWVDSGKYYIKFNICANYSATRYASPSIFVIGKWK